MRKQKKKRDYSLIIHTIAILVFIGVVFSFYYIAGNRHVSNLVKNTENIYKEKMEDSQNIKKNDILKKETPKPTEPFVKYSFKYTYLITMTGPLKKLTVKVPIPQDENEKQYISSLEIMPKPTRMYHQDDSNMAEYDYENINTNAMNIEISGIANVRTYDYKTAEIVNQNPQKEKDLSRYLKSERLIESDDPEIMKIAASLKGNSTRETVNNVYNYTQKRLSYRVIGKDLGAKEAIKARYGKCAEYSAVMTALLRANQIPARVVNGNIARQTNQRHGWVEVYYDNYGWVAYDPTSVGAIVKVYRNGTLVEQKTNIDPEKTISRYIASMRNSFSPISLTYTPGNNGKSSLNLDMKTEIHPIENK